jgi:uracil-DNA glycosylase family 4
MTLSTLKDNPDGCVLPEELRRYYLDAMGIQIWEEANKEVGETTQVSVNAPSASESWQELEQAVQSCELCPLHESRTQTVFGVGSKNAELLVIGEAPDSDEDLKGEPFVGQAGQLLTSMLQAIDLQREDVYIANILKCRPPNDRDPEPSEMLSCSSYLQQQIALMQPKAIFVVGRIAAQALLNTTNSISSLRGKLHSYEGVPLVASYHPAYLLRKPSEKRKSWQDLLQLKKVLEECQ